jgi:hypothetical protein
MSISSSCDPDNEHVSVIDFNWFLALSEAKLDEVTLFLPTPREMLVVRRKLIKFTSLSARILRYSFIAYAGYPWQVTPVMQKRGR